MKKYKRLFIDSVSSDFNINEDIVLGPWCLLSQFSLEEIKNFQRKNIFSIDEEIDEIEAFKTCEFQHSKTLDKFATYVKTINQDKYSLEFYKNYVSNWLSTFIHLVHYSERLINLYLTKYKDKDIDVTLFFKSRKLIVKNSSEFFSKYILDYNCFSNLTLFLLLKRKPKNWKVTYYNNEEKENHNKIFEKKYNMFFKSLKNKISKILAPRINEVYGLNFFEKILLSLILVFKKPINQKNEIKNYYSRIESSKTESPISDHYLIDLAKELMPDSFRKIYKKKEKFYNPQNKIMLCSAASVLSDDDKRFTSMLFKEKGGKIISVQHGGHYGELHVIRASMEFGFDKFISWGQKKHPNYEINFKPLPSPQLKLSYKKNKSDKILFASTVNFFHYPRYIACQSFNDTINRINYTTTFLSEINPKLIEKVNYNLHLGPFTEQALLKKKFKNLTFIHSSLEENLNKHRLVVQNHYSTFFLKCLAANVPTLCFTKRNNWKLNDRALKLYDNLHKAEILFYDPKEAAKKILENWDNLDRWWQKKDLQSARIEFCNEFAMRDNKWLKKWVNYFYNEI